ncbi:hypothetical protein BF1767 [Bacteroides fragilis YCH46]|uniref:Uncharacterized protein n=1 Tax=Bacteroides fragilis (strain YCH46) TaxID=295405 RepID=Q64VG2_BACFR|nr:hypothetical protein BF1767 [Bacteroides fragilis YCH46]
MTRMTNSVHFFKIFTLPRSIFILFCIYYRIKSRFESLSVRVYSPAWAGYKH